MRQNKLANNLASVARFSAGALMSFCLMCQAAPALARPAASEIVVLTKASDMAPEAIGNVLFPQFDASGSEQPKVTDTVDPGQPAADAGVVHVSRRQFRLRGIHVDTPVPAPDTRPLVASSPVTLADTKPLPQPLRANAIAVPINFTFDSAELDGQARGVLDQIGKTLTMPQYAARHLIIEGHTDSLGTDHYNFELSLRRAGAAATYLHDRFGISYDRLTLQGKGGSEPLKGFSGTDAVQRRIQFTAV